VFILCLRLTASSHKTESLLVKCYSRVTTVWNMCGVVGSSAVTLDLCIYDQLRILDENMVLKILNHNV